MDIKKCVLMTITPNNSRTDIKAGIIIITNYILSGKW